MKSNLVNALLLLSSFSTGIAAGSPAGELDPAFGDHGRVLLRDTEFDETAGTDVFLDPVTGKFLVVGDGYYYDDKLLRFNNDGSLDQGFGNQGWVQLDFGGNDLEIGDVEWLGGDKLLIAGALNVYGTPDNVIHGSAFLARMHADGTPDLSFGNGGRAEFDLGGVYEGISEILLQADGRIVVFGTTHRNGKIERVLARYTPDGLPDSSFGSSATPGVRIIDLMGVDAQLAAMVQQSDGKFVACGDATSGPATPDPINLVAIRFHSTGVPDSTFGSNGMLLIGGWQESVTVSTCHELADGHVIFAGSAGSGERQRAAVWRMAPDGSLDSGFGVNGLAALDTIARSRATVMTVLLDGTLAVAGSQWMPDGNDWTLWADMFVSRIDPTSGTVDRDFGNQGMTSIDFGHGTNASAATPASIRQQADGKLVVVGSQAYRYDWYYWFNIAVARIDPYGSGSNGWAGMIDSQVQMPVAGGNAVVRLRRTGGSTGQLTVDYSTVADTAVAGQDYIATSGTVTWADGDLGEKTLSIAVLAPSQLVNNRYFHVELSNSSGGLARDRATIILPPNNISGGGGVIGGGSGSVGSGGASSGGGAMGIDLILLMLAGVFRFFRRELPHPNQLLETPGHTLVKRGRFLVQVALHIDPSDVKQRCVDCSKFVIVKP